MGAMTTTTQPILAVNAGSSSLKFALHACAVPAPDPAAALADAILSGHAQGLEPGGTARFKWQLGDASDSFALDAAGAPGSTFDRAARVANRQLL